MATGLAQMATQADVDTQKKNLEVLAQVERLRDLVADLGTTAAYLSQAEMVLPTDHPWIAQVQAAGREILNTAGTRLRATPTAPLPSPASRLLQPKATATDIFPPLQTRQTGFSGRPS